MVYSRIISVKFLTFAEIETQGIYGMTYVRLTAQTLQGLGAISDSASVDPTK